MLLFFYFIYSEVCWEKSGCSCDHVDGKSLMCFLCVGPPYRGTKPGMGGGGGGVGGRHPADLFFIRSGHQLPRCARNWPWDTNTQSANRCSVPSFEAAATFQEKLAQREEETWPPPLSLPSPPHPSSPLCLFSPLVTMTVSAVWHCIMSRATLRCSTQVYSKYTAVCVQRRAAVLQTHGPRRSG